MIIKSKKVYNLKTLMIPIIFQAILQRMFGTVDTVVLSGYSDSSVGGVGFANQLISIGLLILMVINSGMSIIMSQYLGADKKREAKDVGREGLTNSLIVGGLLGTLLFVGSPYTVKVLGDSTQMQGGASVYLKVIGLGLIFQALNDTYLSILRVHNKAKSATIMFLACNIVNILGDILVILNPLGLKYNFVIGIAVVTVVSNVTGTVILHRIARRQIGLTSFKWPSKDNLMQLIGYGGPAAGESASYRLSQLVITVMITSLGAYVWTAKTYTLNILVYLFMIPHSIGVASSIMVGYEVGKENISEAYKTCRTNLFIALGAMLSLNLILLLSGDLILGLLTKDEMIIAVSKQIILLECVALIFKGGNMVLGGSLRGSGDVIYPVTISIVSMWLLGVGVAYVLGIHLGYGILGIYIAVILDESIRCMLLLKRWKSKRWMEKRIVSERIF